MRANVFLLGLLSFLIVAFGHPNFCPWAGPIAGSLGFAIFWRAIRIYPFSRQRFWRATLWFSAISLVQLSWMSSIEFQGVYILIVWLALSVWLGLQFGILSILIPYNRPLSWGRIFAIASFWTLLEWSRFHVLCGYSWNLSGLSLINTPALQFAAVFGILGLSFCVMLTNLVALRAFLRKGIGNYALWFAVALFPYLFGLGHLHYHEREMEKGRGEEPFSCVLVQTGLLPSEKVPLRGKIRSFVSPYEQWERILTFVRDSGTKSPDLIVLPEGAVPFTSEQKVYTASHVYDIFASVLGEIPQGIFPNIALEEEKVSNTYWARSMANFFDSDVAVGLDHIDKEGKSYNSAFLFQPGCQTEARYDKRVLVPLAEYLPFRFLLPLVKSYGISGFFTHGKEAKVFEGKLPLSLSICYEETFPHMIREGRAKGAELLVNLTNDGWYPFSRLSSQHYEHARVRAVENGASLIRACNSGVSAAVDSLGRPLAVLKETTGERFLQAGPLSAEFIPYTYSTLYLFWGNGGILALSLFFILIFLALRRQYRL